MSWATRAPGARPRCTLQPPNGVAKLHFGAHFQAPCRCARCSTGPPGSECSRHAYSRGVCGAAAAGADRLDTSVGPRICSPMAATSSAPQRQGRRVLLRCVAGLRLEVEEDTAASAPSAQVPRRRGRRRHAGHPGRGLLEGYHNLERLCLEHRAHLDQFGCRYRLGTASNLVTLSVEGVSQMVYILPERLLTLVRPAFDLVLQRIQSLKRCVQA